MNTALRDAALLCRQLKLAAAGGGTVVQAMADCEAAILPCAFARVADSLRDGTSGDDRLYRPVIGRLSLTAARGYFALTGRVPRLRKVRRWPQLPGRRGLTYAPRFGA